MRIRDVINTTVDEDSEAVSKIALRHLADDYLSFLDGDRKSPEVWMGLWTADQLKQFGTNGCYPFRLLAALKKLFFSIGKYLTERIILLWQSRQLEKCELAKKNADNPI